MVEDIKLFREGPGPGDQTLFKNHVRFIHLEVTAYCNRKCGYCPVSLHPRPSKQKRMSWQVIGKILDELKSIQYDGWMNFTLFNEPLGDLPFLLEVMNLFKSELPGINFYLNSNGDFLTKDVLDKLISNGLKKINITLHQDKVFSNRESVRLLRLLLKRLDFKQEVPVKLRPNSMDVFLKFGELEAFIFSRNYDMVGVNRGEALQHLAGHSRQGPCTRPFDEFAVSFDGAVIPCCQFMRETLVGDTLIAGRVLDKSIFEIFSSQLFRDFRRDLFVNGPKKGACASCADNDTPLSSEENSKRVSFLNF